MFWMLNLLRFKNTYLQAKLSWQPFLCVYKFYVCLFEVFIFPSTGFNDKNWVLWYLTICMVPCDTGTQFCGITQFLGNASQAIGQFCSTMIPPKINGILFFPWSETDLVSNARWNFGLKLNHECVLASLGNSGPNLLVSPQTETASLGSSKSNSQLIPKNDWEPQETPLWWPGMRTETPQRLLLAWTLIQPCLEIPLSDCTSCYLFTSDTLSSSILHVRMQEKNSRTVESQSLGGRHSHPQFWKYELIKQRSRE